jgi:hypothetical protein
MELIKTEISPARSVLGRNFCKSLWWQHKNCNADHRTSSVTAKGTSSEVTSALRLMAMPANTPATAST